MKKCLGAVVPLSLIGLLVTSAAPADIYRWTDANGKVHFTDKPPVDQQTEKVEVRVNTYESVSYDTSIFDTGKKVVLYSASWCGYCKKAKQYFRSNNIAFTEYDIEKSAKAKREYDRLGARGVPVILVGKQRMNGFSEKGFERLYARAGVQ
ncbi:glutaredoxin domain-containing protein [Thiosocius teredinicola]|uniref:glutaredoxin domain-containing protein n=1 Tax=Thiosocius teredinicola TaxID=1973002 RepID=UPI000991494E